MEGLPWFWIWVVLTALLCIGEMLTMSFFMLPFAVGAGVAAIANALGANLVLQLLLFAAVSVACLFLMRPLAKRITAKNDVVAGADRLLGSSGEVVEGSAPPGEFRVLVQREAWNALCEDGSIFEVGTDVRVVRIDGTHLVVERA